MIKSGTNGLDAERNRTAGNHTRILFSEVEARSQQASRTKAKASVKWEQCANNSTFGGLLEKYLEI